MSGVAHRSGGGIELLLGRLKGVKPSGRNYRARCPSCGGRSEKVSLRETDNGAVLMHAFCGCSPAQVLDALGLSLSALFPPRLKPTTPEERRASCRAWREGQWSAVLPVLVFESTVVLIAGRQLAEGEPLSAEDGQRLAEAVARIENAREVLRGH